ncbi:hypothetical protein I4U23_014526 [Adineta vaga]|nr:hypothetical protein I4U23_014526 [Adineta vaga]
MDFESNYTPSVKLKYTINRNQQHDIHCFECHYEGDVINCCLCPRVYHIKCLGLNTLPDKKWACPECKITISSLNIFNSEYQTENELHIMLQCALYRLKSQPQSKAFINSIDAPEYLEYIIHPMSLELIEKNIQQKKYHSTDAFMGDIKWILHNKQSKLTANARTLLKNSHHEMTEIHICSECYLRGSQFVAADWFTVPCAIPHTLCWAKMKSYQTWPAKVLRIMNDQVDVRFFGTHNRAWIPINKCFVLSKDYPGSIKKKLDVKFDKSLTELQLHVDRLKKLYGHFTYAPLQTTLSKTKPFKFVSIIDVYRSSYSFSRKKSIQNDDTNLYEQPAKRSRLCNEDNLTTQDSKLQPKLHVVDIFHPSIDQESSTSLFRSSSPTDNKFQIQALLRRYTSCKSPIDDSISEEVRLTMDSLLDTVDALKTISEVSPMQHQRAKRSRKIQSHTKLNFNSYPSLDSFMSPFISLVPLTSLSINSPRIDISECESRPSKAIIHEPQSSIATNSFLISPPTQTDIQLSTPIPNFPSISRQIVKSSSSSDSSLTKPRKATRRRLVHATQYYSSSNSDSREIPSDNLHQTRNEMQSMLNNFNSQFQEVLTTLTAQIQSSLETTRLKYEKDLEELHRSYRQSLNDFHSIANEQIQEIHKNLEVQYWTRLSELRHRYENKLSYH